MPVKPKKPRVPVKTTTIQVRVHPKDREAFERLAAKLTPPRKLPELIRDYLFRLLSEAA